MLAIGEAYLGGLCGGDLTLFESQPCQKLVRTRDLLALLRDLPVPRTNPLLLSHNLAQRTISYPSIGLALIAPGPLVESWLQKTSQQHAVYRSWIFYLQVSPACLQKPKAALRSFLGLI